MLLGEILARFNSPRKFDLTLNGCMCVCTYVCVCVCVRVVRLLQAHDAGGRAHSEPVPFVLRTEALSSQSRGSDHHSEPLPRLQGTRAIQAQPHGRRRHTATIQAPRSLSPSLSLCLSVCLSMKVPGRGSPLIVTGFVLTLGGPS